MNTNREIILPEPFAEPLLNWYENHARVLPWRDDPTPYHVWISEIMLQQTRVEAVKPYYAAFIKALPNVTALAEVSEDVLLKLWQGLGYYSRAHNLQKAARIVQQEYDGELPNSYDLLLKLPGIGAYTAAAISSIAFGERQAVVDGNVIRVIARLCADGSDYSAQKRKQSLKSVLENAMPQERAGDFNQAMMELGALVCLPNGMPLCSECPLSSVCKAHAQGKVTDYPVAKPAKARRKEAKTIIVIRCRDRIALNKRSDKGVLKRMWEFPNSDGLFAPDEITKVLHEEGFSVLKVRSLGKAKHIFTHIEWEMTGYEATVSFVPESCPYVWASAEEIEEQYSVPSAFRFYAKQIL